MTGLGLVPVDVGLDVLLGPDPYQDLLGAGHQLAVVQPEGLDAAGGVGRRWERLT